LASRPPVRRNENSRHLAIRIYGVLKTGSHRRRMRYLRPGRRTPDDESMLQICSHVLPSENRRSNPADLSVWWSALFAILLLQPSCSFMDIMILATAIFSLPCAPCGKMQTPVLRICFFYIIKGSSSVLMSSMHSIDTVLLPRLALNRSPQIQANGTCPNCAHLLLRFYSIALNLSKYATGQKKEIKYICEFLNCSTETIYQDLLGTHP
jgi:hypothetical protein